MILLVAEVTQGGKTRPWNPLMVMTINGHENGHKNGWQVGRPLIGTRACIIRYMDLSNIYYNSLPTSLSDDPFGATYQLLTFSL